MIADEPTTALDVTVEASIMRLLDKLSAKNSMALLLVTHDLGLVAEHSDTVAVMYAGYVVERCTTAQLFDRPLHPYTSALLESMPGLYGEKILKTIEGNVPEPGGEPSGCVFRDRCPLEVPKCADAMPDLKQYESDCVDSARLVRCIRAGEHV